MEGVLIGVLGLGILAVSPFVPGLRQVARKLVSVSLAVASTTTAAAAVTGEQWKDLIAEAQADRNEANQMRALPASPKALEDDDIVTITIPS